MNKQLNTIEETLNAYALKKHHSSNLEHPVITTEEYILLKTKIKDEINTENEKMLKELKPLLKKIIRLQNNLVENVAFANKLLLKLQRELYKAPVIEKSADGTRTMIVDDKIDNVDVLDYLDDILLAELLTKISGE